MSLDRGLRMGILGSRSCSWCKTLSRVILWEKDRQTHAKCGARFTTAVAATSSSSFLLFLRVVFVCGYMHACMYAYACADAHVHASTLRPTLGVFLPLSL